MATPFRVDALGPEAHGLPGWLLLGFAPGRRPAPLAEDLRSLRKDHGARGLVCLLEAHELEALGISDLLPTAESMGLEALPFPIPDGGVPESFGALDALVGGLLARLRAGERVFIHCWAGLGRTGTVACACLIARGMGVREALRLVRSVRPGTVETAEQERFLQGYAEWRARSHNGGAP